MKLSIIVPIYKVEDYIVRCMEGILHQDLEDYEVIAVDDGSPDRSVEILQEYLNTHPVESARVRIIRKENGGLSDARNAGIAEATGEYLWFVDSDDTIAENCLGALYKTASAGDLDLLMFDEQNIRIQNGQYNELPSISRAGKLTGETMSGIDLFIELRRNHVFYASACGYWVRRGVLMENNLRFYKGILHEDELFTPQAMHYSHRAAYLSECPYIRYVREDSITTSENIDRLVAGYGTAITELLQYGDHIVEREDEQQWLHEDIVSLAQILFGKSSQESHLSDSSKAKTREVSESLRKHGLELGLKFRLYTWKNRLLRSR